MSSPGKQQNEETYEVERVIDISWPEENSNSSPLYRVRWAGFPPIDDTWEPIDNFVEETTRKLVKQFNRRYSALQEKELQVMKELGGSGSKVPKHVNILSREILSIKNMNCDTTREPPLWFYLVVWRGEKLEDATWESEVYLRHASDMILQYEAKHKAEKLAQHAKKKKSKLSTSTNSSPKLFLDAPSSGSKCKKQKMTFVPGLIEDSDVSNEQIEPKNFIDKNGSRSNSLKKRLSSSTKLTENLTSSSKAKEKNKKKECSLGEKFRRIRVCSSGDESGKSDGDRQASTTSPKSLEKLQMKLFGSNSPCKESNKHSDLRKGASTVSSSQGSSHGEAFSKEQVQSPRFKNCVKNEKKNFAKEPVSKVTKDDCAKPAKQDKFDAAKIIERNRKSVGNPKKTHFTSKSILYNSDECDLPDINPSTTEIVTHASVGKKVSEPLHPTKKTPKIPKEKYKSKFANFDNMPEYKSKSAGFVHKSPSYLSEEKFLLMAQKGDYERLLDYIESADFLADKVPPLKPLIISSLKMGNGAVAQLLAALHWNLESDIDFRFWSEVVKMASQKGDLSMLMVLAQMLSNDQSKSGAKKIKEHILPRLQIEAFEGASKYRQYHIIDALNSVVNFAPHQNAVCAK